MAAPKAVPGQGLVQWGKDKGPCAELAWGVGLRLVWEGMVGDSGAPAGG